MQIGERLKGAAAVRETAGLPLKRSSLLVYILGKNEAGLYGMVLGGCREQPVKFEGLDRLVLLIDELSREDDSASMMPLNKSAFMELGTGSYAVRYRARDLLQVSVTGREHAGLQGCIRGRFTGGKSVHFRSVLELLRMLRYVL